MFILYILLGILGVVALLTLICFVLTFIIFNTYFRRVKDFERVSGNFLENMDKTDHHGDIIRQGMAYIAAQNFEEFRITSRDGLSLFARYLPADSPTERLVVLVHGYHSSSEFDFSAVVEFYHNHGFDILLPDQRTHGKSEGKYITFGSFERYDIVDWVNFIINEKGPRKILMDGVSMGCTTSILAAAEPDIVPPTYIVADCGYTSPDAIFRDVFAKWFNLPTFPILNFADFLCRRLAKFSFHEFSTEDAVRRLPCPVTFVHGEADDFVSIENTHRNFAACNVEKKLLTVPDAGHGISYLVDTPRLQAELERIFKEYF